MSPLHSCFTIDTLPQQTGRTEKRYPPRRDDGFLTGKRIPPQPGCLVPNRKGTEPADLQRFALLKSLNKQLEHFLQKQDGLLPGKALLLLKEFYQIGACNCLHNDKTYHEPSD